MCVHLCVYLCVYMCVCLYVCIFVCIYMCVDVCTKHIYIKPLRAICVYMAFKRLWRGYVFAGAVSYSGNLWHGVYKYVLYVVTETRVCIWLLGGYEVVMSYSGSW